MLCSFYKEEEILLKNKSLKNTVLKYRIWLIEKKY